MDTSLFGILALLVGLLLLGVVALLFLVFRKSGEAEGLLGVMQNLTQSIGGIHTELRGLSERVSTVQGNQNRLSQNVATLRTGLAETGVAAQGLAETTSFIRAGLTQAQQSLTTLQTQAKARQELEQQTAAAIKRLEGVIAGVQTKGSAGENIIEVVFAQLPPEWQMRDFRVGNKTVEFGLRLPNNLVLPIDSKWTATHLLEQFLASDDAQEQARLKARIEKAVYDKAKEVRKYIDPSITVNFGIAAVPDAIYDLCSSVQVKMLRLNVALVSYGMFVPYLLLVFQTILRTSQDIDLEKLNSYLKSVQDSIEAMQDELEGRLSRSITMLSNSRDEMRVRLGKVNSGLTSLRIGTGSDSESAKPREAKLVDAARGTG